MMSDEPEKPATAQELKTERVQLLMSPSEVTAIDDWGFSNRIRTRAEAMRRLCQIGLAADDASSKRIMRLSVEVATKIRVDICEGLLSILEGESIDKSAIKTVLDQSLEIAERAVSLVHLTAGESFADMIRLDEMDLNDVPLVAGEIRSNPQAYAMIQLLMRQNPNLSDEELLDKYGKWREEQTKSEK